MTFLIKLIRGCCGISILTFLCCGVSKSSMEDQISPIVVSLSESACLGDCPVFELDIHANQTVRFNGGKNTLQKTGLDTLTNEEFTKIQSLLHSPYFQLEEHPQMNKILDAPVSRIRYIDGKAQMEVTHQGIEPEPYSALKVHLEKVAIKRGWLPASAPRGEQSEREIIVELNSESHLDELIANYAENKMVLIKKISPSQLYYLFSIKATSGQVLEDVLSKLRMDSMVKMAQWNHQLEKRDP